MQVSQVKYGITKSDGDYGNQRIEVTVELDPGESADDAFNRARDWVERKMAGTKAVEVTVGGRRVAMSKAKADALAARLAEIEDEEVPF